MVMLTVVCVCVCACVACVCVFVCLCFCCYILTNEGNDFCFYYAYFYRNLDTLAGFVCHGLCAGSSAF